PEIRENFRSCLHLQTGWAILGRGACGSRKDAWTRTQERYRGHSRKIGGIGKAEIRKGGATEARHPTLRGQGRPGGEEFRERGRASRDPGGHWPRWGQAARPDNRAAALVLPIKGKSAASSGPLSRPVKARRKGGNSAFPLRPVAACKTFVQFAQTVSSQGSLGRVSRAVARSSASSTTGAISP